jgi:hypothetical protein
MTTNNFMYNASKLEALVMQSIRSDKASSSKNKPQKAGHVWVEDPTVQGGGFFRKLPKGAKAATGIALGAGLVSAAIAAGLATRGGGTETDTPASLNRKGIAIAATGAAGVVASGIGLARNLKEEQTEAQKVPAAIRKERKQKDLDSIKKFEVPDKYNFDLADKKTGIQVVEYNVITPHTYRRANRESYNYETKKLDKPDTGFYVVPVEHEGDLRVVVTSEVETETRDRAGRPLRFIVTTELPKNTSHEGLPDDWAKQLLTKSGLIDHPEAFYGADDFSPEQENKADELREKALAKPFSIKSVSKNNFDWIPSLNLNERRKNDSLIKTAIKTDFMYDAGKIEASAIAAQIRSDKANSSKNKNKPQKAGYVWVEDLTVQGSGFFRKLPRGKKDTPKAGKTLLAGLGSAALATGAIAGVKALHSQAEAAANESRAKRIATGVAAGAGAGVGAGVGAGAIAYKKRKDDELGRDKIQGIENLLRQGDYTEEVDKENNIAHWKSPDGHMISLGHVEGTSFFASNVRESDTSKYSMDFSINTLGQGAIAPKVREQLLDKIKKSLNHQISVTPDGFEIGTKHFLPGAADPELDITKEERNTVYRGLGFYADRTGRVKGGKIAASDNLDSIYWQARADAVNARTGVPTKPGYTWVADKRAAKGGYFRKLRPGQPDPNAAKGANAQPQPGGGQQPKVPAKQPAAAKSGGGGNIGGAVAGGALAAAVTAAIAAGGTAAGIKILEQQQEEEDRKKTVETVKKLAAGSALATTALAASHLAPDDLKKQIAESMDFSVSVTHAVVKTGIAQASIQYNQIDVDPLINALPFNEELKTKAKNLVGQSKIAVVANIMELTGYTLDGIDEKNNLSHWSHPSGKGGYSIGSAGSHSFLMGTRKITDNAARGASDAYETAFSVDFGHDQKKVSSAEGKKIISLAKASFINQASKLPNGSLIGVEAYADDKKGEARNNIYQKFGFKPSKRGGLWAEIQNGKIVGSEKKGKSKKPAQEVKEDSLSLDDSILLYLYGKDRFDAYIEAREDALKRVNVPAKGDRDAYSYTREVGDKVNVRPDLKQNPGLRLSSNNFFSQLDFVRIKTSPAAITEAEAARAAGAHANSVWPMTIGDVPYLYKPVMGETTNNTTRKEGATEVLLSAMARVAGIPSQSARLVPKALDAMRPDLPAPGVAIKKIAKSRTLLDDEPEHPNPDTYLPMEEVNMKPRRYLNKMLSHPDLAKIAALDTFTMNIDRHGGNIMVTDDETGSPKYGGKRYHAIDNGAAYEPMMGGSPHDILAKEILNMGDRYKGDRVRKENLKLYVNTLKYLSNEYPVAKIQAHMAQLNTAIDPYDEGSLGLEAVSDRSARREASTMKTIAATHRGAQKVLNAAKMIGVG